MYDLIFFVVVCVRDLLHCIRLKCNLPAAGSVCVCMIPSANRQ